MGEQETKTVDIFKLVDEYRALLDSKDELAGLTTENNKTIIAAESTLAKAMIDNECPRISRDGYSYSISEKTEYSKRGCDEEEFFDFLRSNGLGDIIKLTVNAKTLNSAMRETISQIREETEEELKALGEYEEDLPSDWLPEEFAPFISAYSHYSVNKRKETNNTAKKAKEKKA